MTALDNLEQPTKQDWPISETVLGMMMEDSDVQPLKEYAPKSRSPSFRLALSKEVQPLKVSDYMWRTELGIFIVFKDTQPTNTPKPDAV